MAIEKSLLSTDEACRMIEVSAKAGVTELKFRNLDVKFGRTAEIAGETRFVQQTSALPPLQDLTAEQHKKQSEESLEVDALLSREEQLARALVENPLLYEQLLRDGGLTENVVDDSDESGD